MAALATSVLAEKQKEHLYRDLQVEFSFGLQNVARFRAAIFFQRGAYAASFTRIPFSLAPLDQLGLAAVVETLAERTRGLVLIAGGPDSGRTTTLALLVDRIPLGRAPCTSSPSNSPSSTC